MSKGLSWRQRSILKQLLQFEKDRGPDPIAWRELDYGLPVNDSHEKTDTPKGQWNIEQAMRRSLRSLKQRGLVDLGRYAFDQAVGDVRRVDNHELRASYLTADIEWHAVNPDQHIPGQSHIMTGVLLTDEGRRVASEG
jgi:hypothetical protein